MKTVQLLSVLAAAIIATACGSDNGVTPNPNPPNTQAEQIPINIAMGAWTRATDAGFDDDDKVGIYVVNYSGSTAGTLALSGNQVDNMQFAYSSATQKWTPTAQIYWKDKTTHADFYCYFPKATPTSISAHSFAVNTDQSTLAGYKASEFLWGKTSNQAPSSTPVAITANHAMSGMKIVLTPGTGYTADDLASATVTIKNVKTSATINLATGTATATGDATSITPYKETDYYRALIVPQTVAANTSLISVKVGADEYFLVKDVAFTFVANKQHTFTVNINKSTNGVNIDVGKWDEDTTDHGGTAN